PVQLGPSDEIRPSFPSQSPNNDPNRQQQPQSDSSNNLLNDFHDKCNETLGKSLCDQLFGNSTYYLPQGK
ncbi:MAG: hypothetical protein WBY22_09535, partial [Nitrososphaeraceae archaeon]